MREFGFKAWDETAKEMVEHCHPQLFYELGGLFNDLAGRMLRGHKITLLQFTGLKDKNGKKIYEGDIGRDRRGNLWRISFGDKNTASFGATSITDTGAHDELYPEMVSFAWFVMHDFEIIGNIHQHPELLKESERG